MQVLTAKRGMGHEFRARDEMRALRLLGPWKPPVFLLSAVMIILLSRSAVILTSHDDAQMDLSIYQEVGELVARRPRDTSARSSKHQRDGRSGRP